MTEMLWKTAHSFTEDVLKSYYMCGTGQGTREAGSLLLQQPELPLLGIIASPGENTGDDFDPH